MRKAGTGQRNKQRKANQTAGKWVLNQSHLGGIIVL
jgi:hypothetical protein